MDNGPCFVAGQSSKQFTIFELLLLTAFSSSACAIFMLFVKSTFVNEPLLREAIALFLLIALFVTTTGIRWGIHSIERLKRNGIMGSHLSRIATLIKSVFFSWCNAIVAVGIWLFLLTVAVITGTSLLSQFGVSPFQTDPVSFESYVRFAVRGVVLLTMIPCLLLYNKWWRDMRPFI